MKKNKKDKTDIFICECHSFEHQLMFWYDAENKQVYTEMHIVTYKNFFKRLWVGLLYAFGYKSKFGEWDEFIFQKEDIEKLKEFLFENA